MSTLPLPDTHVEQPPEGDACSIDAYEELMSLDMSNYDTLLQENEYLSDELELARVRCDELLDILCDVLSALKIKGVRTKVRVSGCSKLTYERVDVFVGEEPECENAVEFDVLVGKEEPENTLVEFPFPAFAKNESGKLREEPWIWSDTEENDLDSMGRDMVVHIKAGTLRDLINWPMAQIPEPEQRAVVVPTFVEPQKPATYPETPEQIVFVNGFRGLDCEKHGFHPHQRVKGTGTYLCCACVKEK